MSLSASTHDAYIHKIAAASWSTKVHVDADTFCGKKVKRAVMIVSSEPYRKTSLEVRDACCGLIVFNRSLPYQIGYLCFVIVDFWTCVIVLHENWLLEDYTSLFNSVIKIFEKVNNSHQVL